VITAQFKKAGRAMLGAVVGAAAGACIGGFSSLLVCNTGLSRRCTTGSVPIDIVQGAIAGAIAGATAAYTDNKTTKLFGLAAAALTAVYLTNVHGASPMFAGGAALSGFMVVHHLLAAPQR